MAYLQNTSTLRAELGKVTLCLLIFFLLAVETLAIAIRENEEIKGIVIDKKETKLLQYADDTTAVLSDAESGYKLFSIARQI